jgi:hypothetical protein
MQTESMVVATELERVLPNVPTLFDRDDVFYSAIEKRPVEVISARDMRIPLELRPGGYFGYFDPENGDLGVGDAPTYDKAVISTVNMKHAIQWTTKSEWATDDKRKAVLQNLRELLAKSMKEFRRQVDSQCMTAGTGVLGTVTSVSTAGGVDTVTCSTDGYGVRLLRFGQRVSIYNAARTTNRTAGGPVKISALDLANKTFSIPTVAGMIATDVVLPEGLTGSTPVGLYGVPYHVSSSTSGSWLGLTRSTTPEVVANRVNANSSGLALPFGRLAVNKIGDRVGMDNGFKPVAWMHPCQVQAYEELGQLVSVIQKQAKDENLDMYFNDNMQIAGCPIKKSYSWDKTRIDFIIPDLWGRAEMKAAGFYEVDGRRIFEMRGPSGGVATSQVFYLVVSFNLFVKNPAACSYIDGLTVPTGY